jgi:hypothetical protein
VSALTSNEVRKGQYCLVRYLKIIQETFIWYKWTLGDKCGTIGKVGDLLEEAMPMLEVGALRCQATSQVEEAYNRCRQVERIVSQFIDDFELEAVALSSAITEMKT